jgi:hypothetical protein
MPDLKHFMEEHQLPKSGYGPAHLHQINKWIRAQKARPPIPIVGFVKLDDKVAGLVLTRYLHALPENSDVQETEGDRELRDRFAKVGDLVGQSLKWQFTVLPNY